jgi:hypothetical protein
MHAQIILCAVYSTRKMNESSSVGTASTTSPVSTSQQQAQQQAQQQEVQDAAVEVFAAEPTIFSFKVLQHKYMDSKRVGGGSQLFSRVPLTVSTETGVSSIT